MADYEIRQRKGDGGPTEVTVKPPKIGKKKPDFDEEESSWKLDVLRVITFGFCASLALSHFFSGGESLFWNLQNKPNFFRMDWWRHQMVSSLPRVLCMENTNACVTRTDRFT